MQLDVYKSAKIFQKYKIPVSKYEKINNLSDLSKKFSSLQKPLAMKIISQDIIHKSDIGAVVLNIKTLPQAKSAYKKILANSKKHFPNAKLDGIIMQEQHVGEQLFVGGKIDPDFGPIILFGLGGIFVEVMKDISIRLCPITKKEAIEMIREIKGYKIIQGYRGKPIDENELAAILLKVSKLLQKERIKELDINPLIATDKGLIAVDARIIK